MTAQRVGILFSLLFLCATRIVCAASYSVSVVAAPYNAQCNGTTDDSAAIQAAINSVPASGGTVLFPLPTLCGIGAAGLSVAPRSNVTLRGGVQGSGLKALAAPPALAGTAFGPTMVQVTSCKNCLVSGLTFDGGGFTTNLLGITWSRDTIVQDSTFRNAGGNAAMVAAGNTYNSYSANTVSSLVNLCRGFWIGNASAREYESYPTIRDNTITLATHTAIALLAYGADVRGNTLTHLGGTDGSGVALGGINPWVARQVVIADNTITGFPFHGVQSDAQTNADYTQDITVTGNTVRNCTHTGIYIVRARGWSVAYNVVENNVDAGIYVELARDVTVAKNTVRDTRAGGARTQFSGIKLLSQTSALDIQRIYIDSNTVSNHVGDGILVTNANPGTMTIIGAYYNVSTNNSGYGLSVTDVADGNITKVVATGNIYSGNTTGTYRMDPTDAIVN